MGTKRSLEHDPQSRVELAQSLLRHRLSASKVVSVMRNWRHVTRRECGDELQKHSNIETPYGPVTSSICLDTVDGQQMQKSVNNPFALLWAASAVRPTFDAAYPRPGHDCLLH